MFNSNRPKPRPGYRIQSHSRRPYNSISTGNCLPSVSSLGQQQHQPKPAVRYVRKDSGQCAPQPERTSSPPTSEGSGSEVPEDTAKIAEESWPRYIPDVYPRPLCQPSMIPLPTFVSN